jgi:DNA polymerase I
MPFTIEYTDAGVREWHATPDGIQTTLIEDYTPTIYVSATTDQKLGDLRPQLTTHHDVAACDRAEWRTAFRNDPENVLAVDVTTLARVRPLAGWIRSQGRPGTYRLYNVDFSPEFRYVLEQDRDPVPGRDLRVCELTDLTPGTPEAPIETLQIDDDVVDNGPDRVLNALTSALTQRDPDVLVISEASLIPALFETAERWGRDIQLGRRPGYEQLATESTYESYGQIGHSPARYTVPGRVLIDRSNTFFYEETNLAGCLDLVERSRKPLQELAWASIGNVLTAIQIREARERGVLVPWKSWRHEFPKSMRQLHAADRGGFTFAPEVGVHENVHELDFSSLYPNIICTRNVSPDTIRCACHSDRADVPGLGYSICTDRGYLPDVLQPIIDDRDEIKTAIADTDDPDREAALEGRSSALKWILVSCFGYQGFSNAKFGRIECHEAINAYAREILLDAKERLEAGGWRVLHGIVDSLWVTPRPDTEQTALAALAAEITKQTDVRLEYEAAYDWLAFVPLQDSEAGALTKYFGRRADGSYKYRGIECRQRSTPDFVADCQRVLIDTFHTTRDPEAVCHELAWWLTRCEHGEIDPEAMGVRQRTSKSLDAYTHATQTTAALKRATDQDLHHAPGKDIAYVVVDDDKSGRDRVRLPHEPGDGYDTTFYREQLLRAAESVLSPIGWRQTDIEATLADRAETTIAQFSTENQSGGSM